MVRLTHVPMSREEEQEREEALAEVVDPLYPLSRADADADADTETEADAPPAPFFIAAILAAISARFCAMRSAPA